MFSGYGTNTATRFDKVACDLSEVLGTPGLGDGAAAADRVGHALGHGFESVSGDDGLYLRSAAGGIAAFGSPREALAHTSDAVDALLTQPAAANRVLTEVTTPSGVHQLRVQLVAGRRVVGGCYRLHAAPTGQVVVTGYPVAGVAGRDPGPVPRRRRATIADAMRAQLSLPSGIELHIETVLFPLEGNAVWAYLGRGALWGDDIVADLRIIVRADDLSLLVSRDAAMSATWGEGLAYASNPARDGRPAAVRLSDLDSAGTVLRGRVIDVVPTAGDRPQRPLRDWRLDVGDPGFEDVSAYYHLTRAANWFASIVGPGVFSGPPFSPLRVVTGDRATRDWVARFLPSLATVVFGDGALPGARCADICVHELTHAVVWGARQIDEIGPIEARGLNEGYADYAQASFLADPRFGDWVRPAQFRDCSSADIRFPSDPAATADPYAIGSAWAAVLWDLHETIGAGVADALALDTIFYLEETSTIGAARAALLASDAQLFPAGDGGGRHANAITTAYDRRIP
ncbi:MAG: hypothetical protein ACRDST_13990 [Pseudonocardiaceae bacterium]